MKTGKYILLLAGLPLLTAAVFADELSSMSMSGLSFDGMQPAEENLDPAVADSIREVRRLQRIENIAAPARQSYEQLRKMRFEGADEDTFYPLVLQTYRSNLQVLDSLPGEPAFEQAKAVMVDIRPELLDGAFFYSRTGNTDKLVPFARAYVDIPLMPAMIGEDIHTDKRTYPTVAYISASSAYNAGEFEEAIKYFKEYLSTDDDRQREQVYMFMGQACMNVGDYDTGVEAMAEAMVLYPTNRHIMLHGINLAVQGKRPDLLPMFLDKALLQEPDNEQLLLIQGQLLEDRQEFKQALEVFQKLDMMKPNQMSINKHLALNYFNLGVYYYNQAIMEADEKAAKRAKRQSNSYFNEAARVMQTITANDPRDVKYLESLAVCYGCVDDKDRFNEINTKLRALGHAPVREMSMPSMIAFNDDNSTNFGNENTAHVGEIPSYQDYAQAFIANGLAEWGKRGTFEKMEAYNARMNSNQPAQEYVRLCKEAEQAYIKEYGNKLKINDLTLGGYDADHETYLIKTSYGDITLGVPIKGNEAELFNSSWKNVKIRAPRFIIRNDQPAIAEITFVTPNGKSYSYNSADAKNYTYYDPQVDWNSMIAAARASTPAANDNAGSSAQTNRAEITFQSDVDMNIPLVKRPNNNTVALIIANEEYKHVANVASARHDGDIFAEYCEKTLGIPKDRILKYTNATIGDMTVALSTLRGVVGAMNAKQSDVNVLVYYAGHGVPDESTKDAFLLPVDGTAQVTATCVPLSKFYSTLDDLNAKNVMVFLDACFSGAQRGEGMLVEARGVAIKPKETAPQGNMFVLSAASGDETAMPYKEKNHGLFTYFLLKKLQDSKGNVTLADLSKYVISEVKEKSNTINRKPQTPTVTTSGNIGAKLNTFKIRP